MGAWGALIMGFFGAVFASMTLYWQWHLRGVALALPFLGFILIAIAANHVIRAPGEGIKPSPREERVIMWSSIGESVGLHFLPIAFAAGFRPFYGLGTALIVAAIMAAGALWLASGLALRRDGLAKARTA